MNRLSVTERLQANAELAAGWRRQGHTNNTIYQYLLWVDRFCAYCRQRRADPCKRLTRENVARFARSYARQHGISEIGTVRRSIAALRAWARILLGQGRQLPLWKELRRCERPSLDRLLSAYCEWRRQLRGVKDSSLRIECRYVESFVVSLPRGRRLSRLSPDDIERFLRPLGTKFAAATLSVACTSIRAFLRFLHATGRTKDNLALCVLSPMRDKPGASRRGISWKEACRIIRAVDRRTRLGKRDYAILLLMATYGIGGAEIQMLTLDDINWEAQTIRIVRCKTGTETLLPLIAAVVYALSVYVRFVRPQHALVRRLFLTLFAPHRPLSRPALHLIVHKYAASAGVSRPGLGTHAFRHSNASRHIELSTPPKVISDILGHEDPNSISTYVRGALMPLREVSLPVPS